MPKPTIKELAEGIYYYARSLRPEDHVDEDGEVRLQLHAGDWELHTGPSDYDTDHRGAWGASLVSAGATWAACRSVARDLIAEALDHAAQTGQDEALVPVVFRKDPHGDVFALFPTLPASPLGETCTFYQHIGQHGAANYAYSLAASRPATRPEAYELQRELERIGYDLKPILRATQAHHETRREAARKAAA